MSTFSTKIRPHVDAEIVASLNAERTGQTDKAFSHLERAHVLGQASTAHHVRVHWHMLMWAARHRKPGEILGQITSVHSSRCLSSPSSQQESEKLAHRKDDAQPFHREDVQGLCPCAASHVKLFGRTGDSWIRPSLPSWSSLLS
ncbi:DUF3703 domain-containing protein [Piscinibacter sp. HJYY11]|uniref:DUF3703 domain-containing protein n=1 Tax=Piscinibacter sp. HJYY11 TaxID=2801333 RepID=UPI00191D7A11|nr:DUF3703 domain-containing protein [Piscinibacter sp. HJYY11]